MNQQYDIQPANEKDYLEIIEVWEASVRATHHFLPEEEILYFKPLILNEYLNLVELFCVRDASGAIIGFSGIADGKIEMLFIRPDWFGKGVGKRLLLHAVHDLGATEVDVNEQNEQAVGFYEHLGFKVTGRSPLDGLGKPYPLLHMVYRSSDNF